MSLDADYGVDGALADVAGSARVPARRGRLFLQNAAGE